MHRLWINPSIGSSLLVIMLLVATPASAENMTQKVEQILALGADDAYGEYLAGECIACHSRTADASDSIPMIYGKPPETLTAMLLAFQMGARKNPTMQSVAEALNAAEIAALVFYLSKTEYVCGESTSSSAC